MSLQFNVTLTNYARGLAQDKASALAAFLAPEVVVGSAVGQFKSFSDKNAFQIYETARAIGGEATRIQFEADDPTYNCKPHALEIPIDQHERDGYGEGDPLGLERSKADVLVTSAILAHENRVVSKVKAAVAAEAGLGVYSAGANNPIEEIDGLIETIATATGQMPNRLAIGLPAWKILRNHPKVLARFPGAQSVGVTMAQFASLLLNPAIEIRVGILSKDSAKPGKTASKSNLVGSELFVFSASQSPNQFDGSFAKTFRTRTGGVDTVRTYKTASGRADILAVDWTEDIQVTSTVSGKRITVS